MCFADADSEENISALHLSELDARLHTTQNDHYKTKSRAVMKRPAELPIKSSDSSVFIWME